MEYPEELISKHKEIISEIITKFNQIENSIKIIIASSLSLSAQTVIPVNPVCPKEF